jgi:long-chain acyl-CoA synthetase
MNIAELALENLKVGEHTSYIFEGKEITNFQMDRAARRFGNALLKLGVSRGDRVIMQMPNCPEVLQAFQAIWRIGAIALPSIIWSARKKSILLSGQRRAYRHHVSGISG